MPNDATNALKEATRGLLFMSETDEPFRTFTWKDGAGPLTAKKILDLNEREASTKIEEVKLDEFLGTYELGGVFVLTMHPQISGMPSRLLHTRRLIRFMRTGEPLECLWADRAKRHGASVVRRGPQHRSPFAR